MTKSSFLEMNIMLWNHKTKPCWRGCIVHSTSKTQMCFNTPWCDHLFPFESIFYKIKKLKYKLILLCSKCRIKRAVGDFLNLHLLCAYHGHEDIPSIDGLTCALRDALHFFHTLHREAMHVSGSAFALICEPSNQYQVITHMGSHHQFQPIISSPISIEVPNTQLYPYTLKPS